MNPLLQTALMWLDRGITTVPVFPHEKKPIIKWRAWANKLPTQKHLEVWFRNPNDNIALLCGMNNLVVVDFDSLALEKEWMETQSLIWQNVFKNTHRVTTSRGVHVYLYCDELPQARKFKQEQIDIKANGLVMIPPSIHPSGARYIGNDSEIIRVGSLDTLFPKIEYQKFEKKDIPTINPWDVHFDDPIDINYIKKNIPILDVCNWYTNLSGSTNGGKLRWGLCPKHDDHHPSFYANLETGNCRCLSTKCELCCDHGFDVINLFSIMEGITTKEACHRLGSMINR
jgi:hypothetical protein